MLLAKANRLRSAEGEYGQAIALLERLEKQQPGAPTEQDLAVQHANRAELLVTLDRWREAEQDLRQARAWQEKAAAASPDAAQTRAAVAARCHDLGKLLAEHGQFAEARVQLRDAVRQQQAAAAAEPRQSAYRQDLVTYSFDLIEVLLRQRDQAAARQALADLASVLPANAPERRRLAELQARCDALTAARPGPGGEAAIRLLQRTPTFAAEGMDSLVGLLDPSRLPSWQEVRKWATDLARAFQVAPKERQPSGTRRATR